MVFPGSRYSNSNTYSVHRPDGSMVTVLQIPRPGPAMIRGYYRRTGGQRLDAIATAFLQDATAFWRLCDANNSLVPDALGARSLVGIPMGFGERCLPTTNSFLMAKPPTQSCTRPWFRWRSRRAWTFPAPCNFISRWRRAKAAN